MRTVATELAGVGVVGDDRRPESHAAVAATANMRNRQVFFMGFSSLSSLYPVARLLALVGAVICVSSATAAAQLQQGSIQGAVLDADGRLVDGAVVTLLDGLGESVASVTAAGGRFHLTNIAPGTYSLRAEAPPLRGILQRFVVQGALPVHIELRVSPVLTEQIVVRSEGLDQVSRSRSVGSGRRSMTFARFRRMPDEPLDTNSGAFSKA